MEKQKLNNWALDLHINNLVTKEETKENIAKMIAKEFDLSNVDDFIEDELDFEGESSYNGLFNENNDANYILQRMDSGQDVSSELFEKAMEYLKMVMEVFEVDKDIAYKKELLRMAKKFA